MKLNHTVVRCISIVLILQCFPICVSYKSYKCDTCRNFVDNFNLGLEQTARSNFGGGNTNWEEKNLGSYAGSETRFLEILENACEGENKSECHSMIEEYEEHLEIWWFEHHRKGDIKDLFTFLCDDILKICCPKGTFGPKCEECPGGRILPCGRHGVCEGSGSREGEGTCTCSIGYEGEVCDECSERFFSEVNEDGQTVCTACHKSCKTSCTSGLVSSCEDCNSGWQMVSDQGCIDVDECMEGKAQCTDNKYCLNEEGSYRCRECDKSCDGCIGPGNDQCISCSLRHFLKDSECVACHPSCNSSCTDDSNLSCDACTQGWMFDDQIMACVDRNECLEGSHGCDKENQHCSNSPGSFHCSACHSTCLGCMGSGESQCLACKSGFELDENGSCKDVDECKANVCIENERCINTKGSFTCDCIEGYVRRMGSSCFKKNIVEPKKKKSKFSDKSRRKGDKIKESRPSLDDFNIEAGPDGFKPEDIERLGDPLEPTDETFTMQGDDQQIDKEEL